MTIVNQRFIIKILFLVLFLSISVRASEGFAEINGTRLHYEIKGKGHTIVLIHGGLADSRLWDDQFTKFSKNFRVIRYDLRGFGKSDFPVGAFSHVEDLYALLKFLKVEKVSLVGLSLGGIIAADFTLEHPETVEALVLTAFGKTSEAARLFCASMPTKKAYLPPASANWSASSYSTQRYGADYRYANPQPVSDAAWFSANIPSAGNYEIYVWYPANSGYNSSTPFVVSTSSGNAVVNVNQQINGGKWMSIGTHSLSAGDQNVVGVSRWTSTAGYVIADAVKIVRR
jgi:alpha/beta superfamily hydrolase